MGKVHAALLPVIMPIAIETLKEECEMKQGAIKGAAACMGAIIGAGFASGREIMSFFTRYGSWSWAGIILSAAMMGGLAWLVMRQGAQTGETTLSGLCRYTLGAYSWLGTTAFMLLLAVSAGTMAAAAGEIISLVWPARGGYWLGLLATLGLALACVSRGLGPLAAISKVLVPGLLFLFILALRIPAWEGAGSFRGYHSTLWGRALAYGALNMTLAAPVLQETANSLNEKSRRIAAGALGGLLLGLLALGNGVLSRHPELAGEALPMVQLLRNYGILGFYLSAGGLYVAVFTTLLAALRGVYIMAQERLKGPWPLMLSGMAAFVPALMSFSGLVEVGYPILGWLCLALLLGMMVKEIWPQALTRPARRGQRP